MASGRRTLLKQHLKRGAKNQDLYLNNLRKALDVIGPANEELTESITVLVKASLILQAKTTQLNKVI